MDKMSRTLDAGTFNCNYRFDFLSFIHILLSETPPPILLQVAKIMKFFQKNYIYY